jgi:PAS domain S-box-containing protein
MKLIEASSLRVTRLQVFSMVTGIFVATFGFVVFLSSLLNLSTFSTVKTNTALAFVLSGFSLALLARYEKWSKLSVLMSSLVTFIGIVTLLEWRLNTDLYIDEFFAGLPKAESLEGHPGRMTPAAAAAMVLIGLSLIGHATKKTIAIAQGIAIGVLLLGFVPLIGYAYGVVAFYSFGRYSSIALPTAICLVTLSAGLLAVCSNEGLMKAVLGESVGGIMARRLLPAALLLPVLIGWLRLEGQHYGFYDTAMGTALLALTHVVVFFFLILFNARLLRKTEQERALSVAESTRLSVQVEEHLTARNAAWIRVAQSQEQLAALIDSASDAIISVDENQNITLFNPAAERMLGVTKEAALHHPISRFIEMELSPVNRHEPQSIIGPDTYLVSTTEAAGRKLQLEASISHAENSRGKSATFILRDVTERRRAEQVAKESEERLNIVIESLTEGLVIADLDGQILHWNEAALKAHGFATLEECLLKLADFQKIFKLSTCDGRVLKIDEWPLSKIIAGEILADYEVRVQKINSNWSRIFSYGGSIVKEPNGQRLAFVTINDITERKQFEESLREQAKILDLAPVIIRDLEDRIMMWNFGAEQMYRWSADEALNKVSHSLLHTEFPRPLEEITARLLDRDHWEGELVHFRKDGIRLVVASQWVLHRDEYGNPKAVLEINNDITERKLAEEEIKRLNEELEQRVIDRTAQLQAANKELEAFSYSVSHDLRAPLRHINGFSQALLEDYEDKLDAMGKSYLNEVRMASQEMAHLIDDVLQLARVTRTEMHREPVNLSELAQGVLSELQKVDRERSVDINIQSDLAVQCDRRLMRIVLANLLGNAWKFTSQRPHAEVTFGQAKANGEHVYFVRDNGAGFDMAFAGKLFGAFQRLHTMSEFEGTGIGLATVQRIINRHGGRVWAEGKPNEGATFYFALPGFMERGDEKQSDFSR